VSLSENMSGALWKLKAALKFAFKGMDWLLLVLAMTQAQFLGPVVNSFHIPGCRMAANSLSLPGEIPPHK